MPTFTMSPLPLPVSADKLSLLILALGAALLCGTLMRLRPRVAAVVWFMTLCFVPCWIEVTLKFSFPAVTALTILLVVALFPTVPKDLSVGDWLIGAFFVASVVPFAFGIADQTSIIVLLTYWGSAYVAGRVLALRTGLDWIYRCVAVAFTVVSIGAIVEFAFSWNPFTDIAMGNSLYETWGTLQERGGMMRAEGAFGHSIALGASVALVIPVVVASRFTFKTRALMVIALLACEVVTFSRAGMVCAALSVALVVLFGREGLSARVRGISATVLVVVGAVAAPMITETYAAAGQEASNSAEYRFALTSLIPQISLFGQSPAMYISASGDRYFGGFHSIDSELILLGLIYGLVPLALVLALLVGGLYLVSTRQATAPTIGVVAQLPAFVSVALITQYQVLVWFMVGLAICTQAARRRSHRRSAPWGLRDHELGLEKDPDTHVVGVQRTTHGREALTCS